LGSTLSVTPDEFADAPVVAANRRQRLRIGDRPGLPSGESRIRDMGDLQGRQKGAHYNGSMLRLVLDTNVVLDLFHWGNTDAVPIMAALEAGLIECMADQRWTNYSAS
jgi:hypothetical protein